MLKHGKHHSSEYRAWSAMKQRCYNVKNPNYVYYGERGIVVCIRWLDSFENFLLDMGEKPSEAYSLDRIDNNGNYTMENCRWSTSKIQMNNTRGKGKLTFELADTIRAEYKLGDTTLTKLAIKYGVGKSTIGYVVSNSIWRS